MRRWGTMAIVVALSAGFFYVSRFWDFRLWSRDGLFGFEALRPQGGLLDQWLRGTIAAPFELLIWAVGIFAILTFAQKLYDRMTRDKD